MFAFETMMKIPGNLSRSRAPALLGIAPKTSTQAFFVASGSGTTKWMCPSETPASFGGASCGNAAEAESKSREMARELRIGLKYHTVNDQADYQSAAGCHPAPRALWSGENGN